MKAQEEALKRQRDNEARWVTLLKEAIEIRYLIVKSGRMATKSAVEDVLMARHKDVGLNRYEAHDVMNHIEFHRLDQKYFKFRQGVLEWVAQTALPVPSDYPELEVLSE